MRRALIVLTFVAFVFSLMGCAISTQVMSNYDTPVLLNGKRIVLTGAANKQATNVRDVVIKVGVNRFALQDVSVAGFYPPKSLTLSEHPEVDFAKENKADYLLFFNLTHLYYTGGSFSSMDALCVLFDVKTGKPVWKADIECHPQGLSSGAHSKIIKALVDGVITQLTTDGFLQKKNP